MTVPRVRRLRKDRKDNECLRAGYEGKTENYARFVDVTTFLPPLFLTRCRFTTGKIDEILREVIDHEFSVRDERTKKLTSFEVLAEPSSYFDILSIVCGVPASQYEPFTAV
jgi:hypothetical protein